MTKREARERALTALYQMDVTGVDPVEALAYRYEVEEIKPIPLSEKIVRGVVSQRETIDGIISKYSKEWDISRFSNVDRNILRMAIYEMLFIESIPEKVSINEAIELSKLYSTEDAYKFINGLLAQVIKEKKDTLSNQ